ncbi:nucleotide-diphospho-sugar transferase [Piromyces finnis]|uniref:Nucleotide-diphospho-sugar transferase n=1 Tax=Piromyces finnis TaxID=1754191 RepID=A0A1Y1UXG0_9FUNG|nr:nucleotide-diphospho-sugar transferase [Piromyces finnis]|eukprot:ORX42817.1 nucleotide-diphospho-sugar transferase [Piromyces finnis]
MKVNLIVLIFTTIILSFHFRLNYAYPEYMNIRNDNDDDFEEFNIGKRGYNVKVSIVIPAYNLEDKIGRCIESALNQTLKDIEIIVIDDKSTDATKSVIQEYERMDDRIKAIYSKTNNGAGYSRNLGIEKAEGKFIGFIDGDDYVDPGWFEHLYNNKKRKDIVHGVRVIHNFSETFTKSEEKPYGCIIPSIIRKRFLMRRNIRFPTFKENCEDVVFKKRLYRKKPRKAFAPDTGVYYHYDLREGSLSNYTNPNIN